VIFLFHGADDYRVREALRDLRISLADAADLLESNTTVLDGRALAPDELIAHVTAVPFLAPHRLVIVEGLLRTLGEGRGGRRKKGDDPFEPWRECARRLADAAVMPPSTVLVFLEGELPARNPAFPIFAPIAKTVEFAPLDKGDLAAWVTDTAAARRVNLTPRATAALVQLVGADLWAMSNEIDRLGAYADGGLVEIETVQETVAAAQETKMWTLSDAIVAGDEAKALGALRRLLTDGLPPRVLSSIITRQFRQLVIVKDMRDRRMRQDEIARAAGLPPFRLSAVGAIASRYGWPALRAAYARMLEADLAVKRGEQDDESSLQLLVHDLCTLAPRPLARPAGRR
jgi:DNA polymerase-3 subunit delta